MEIKEKKKQTNKQNKNKNKWELAKLKSFFTMKETIVGEIVANEATEELILKIHNLLMQLNTGKINDPIQKWAK